MFIFGLLFFTNVTASTLCSDGWISPSNGAGTCSQHGGIYTEPRKITAICTDQTVSFSVDRQGACSHHGGVQYWIEDDASQFLSDYQQFITNTSEVGEGMANLGVVILEDERLRNLALTAGVVTLSLAGAYVVARKKYSDETYRVLKEKIQGITADLKVVKKNITWCDEQIKIRYSEISSSTISSTERLSVLKEVEKLKVARAEQQEAWNTTIDRAIKTSKALCIRFNDCDDYDTLGDKAYIYE